MKCLGGTFTRGPSLDMCSPASLGPGCAEPLGDYMYCAHKYFKLMLFDFMYHSHSAAFVLILFTCLTSDVGFSISQEPHLSEARPALESSLITTTLRRAQISSTPLVTQPQKYASSQQLCKERQNPLPVSSATPCCCSDSPCPPRKQDVSSY